VASLAAAARRRLVPAALDAAVAAAGAATGGARLPLLPARHLGHGRAVLGGAAAAVRHGADQHPLQRRPAFFFRFGDFVDFVSLFFSSPLAIHR